MERVKQVLSRLVPKQKQRIEPKWGELSIAWRAGVIFIFTVTSVVYLGTLLLSCAFPALKQHLNWLALLMIFDIYETAGIVAVFILSRVIVTMRGKRNDISYRGSTFLKLMFGWIGPLSLSFILRPAENVTKLPQSTLLSLLDFLPNLKAELPASPFLQGCLLYANMSLIYLYLLPLAPVLYGVHRIWRYWKATRAEGGVVLSGEDELGDKMGEEDSEKTLIIDGEPSLAPSEMV